MRYGLLVLAISLGVVLSQGWLTRVYDHATTAALSEDARVAVKVGCRGAHGHAERKCRAMLKKLYFSGALDPDKTLRSYCDSVRDSRWGGSRPAPPKVCVQRYGGWRQS